MPPCALQRDGVEAAMSPRLEEDARGVPLLDLARASAYSGLLPEAEMARGRPGMRVVGSAPLSPDEAVPMNKDLNDARAKDADSVDGDLTMAIPYHYKHPLPPPATPTATTIATLSMLVDLHNSAPAVVDSFTAIKLSCSDEDSATVISTRFGSLVSNFKCTVVLILHQCQLTNLDGLNLPSLLLCDLQYNNIADVGVLVRLTSACKRIRDFDVRDNPVVSTWGWKHKQDRFLCHLPWLESLNAIPVRKGEGGVRTCSFGFERAAEQLVVPQDKLASAIMSSGGQLRQKMYQARVFSERVRDLDQELFKSRGLSPDPTLWDAANVLELNVAGQSLQAVFVSRFVNLRLLNVSSNTITDLTQSGLSACTALTELDASDNCLFGEGTFPYLAFLPSLQKLKLGGNSDLIADEAYRLKVIYWTAQSQGVAGSTGLSELDDQVVVMGERIASLQCCYSPKAEPQRLSSAAVNTAVGLFHARYVIMQELRFGRRALHDWHPLRYSAQADGSVNTGTYPLASLLLPPVSSGPLTNITTLHLPRVGLTVFDTRGMVNLEELNLEGNRLVGSGIIGLGGLTGLRVLNVSGNPELVRSDVLSALLGKAPKATRSDGLLDAEYEPLHNLESLTLGWSVPRQGIFATWWEDRKHSPFATPVGTNIEAVVLALVPHNKYLRVIDGLMLPPPAIAAAYKQNRNWSNATYQEYLLRLAVCMCCTPPLWVSALAASNLPLRSVAPAPPSTPLPGEQLLRHDDDPSRDEEAGLSVSPRLRLLPHPQRVSVIVEAPSSLALGAVPRGRLHASRGGKALRGKKSVRRLPLPLDDYAQAVPVMGAVEEKEGAPEAKGAEEMEGAVESKNDVEEVAAADAPGGPDDETASRLPSVPSPTNALSQQCSVESEGPQLNALSSPAIQRRSHHPDDVYPDVQFVPEAVTLPINLSMMSLRVLDTTIVNLARFHNVTVLVLAHNKLVDISDWGLPSMRSLRFLDLHDNAIKTDRSVIGSILSQLPNLQAVALRNNPCMRSSSKRRELLRYIPSLWQSLDCSLSMIDTALTLDEVVEAWQGAGGSEVETERFRWLKVVKEAYCGPPGQVLALNLSGKNLAWMDLSPFTSLEKLDLSKNRFTAEALAAGGSFGLCGLGALKELNLSGNPLTRGLSKATPRDILFLMLNTLSALERLWLTQSPSQESKCSDWWLSQAPAEGRPGSPIRSAGSQFRSEILSSFPMLRALHCPFRELDNQEIETWEVAECVHGQQKTEEKELFRFQLCVARSVGRKPVEDLVELTLSSCNLYALDGAYLAAAVNLRTLKLGYNNLNDAALEQANLGALSIRELDIQANPIGSMATIGAIVEGNRGLVELLAAKCSCFADNSSHYRVQLLTQTPRCALQGFRLLLNDVPVSVEERLAAVKQASLPVQIFCEGGVDTLPANKETVARLHLALSLHEAGAPWERKEISLRQQGLTYIADLAWHPVYHLRLRSLDLSGNKLTTLKGQALGHLLALQYLNLSGNPLADVVDVLYELEHCAALTDLVLQMSDMFPGVHPDVVFDRLRGLRTFDGAVMPDPLRLEDDMQLEAMAWLNQAFGLHANAITSVDLSNRELDTQDYPPVISALACFPVRHLLLTGNKCDVDCNGHKLQQFQVSVALLPELTDVNMRPVDDDIRVNARGFMVRNHPEFLERLQWVLVRDSPATRALLERQAVVTEQKMQKKYLDDRQDRCSPMFLGFDSHALITEPGASVSSVTEEAQPEESKSESPPPRPGLAVLPPLSSSQRSEPPPPPSGVNLAGVEVSNPHIPPSDVIPSSTVSSRAAAHIPDATGSVLNKFEVLIHYFQVFSLMSLLSIHVQWPKYWREFKAVLDWPANLFYISLVGAFARIDVKLTPNDQIYMRYAFVMVWPPVLLAIFWKWHKRMEIGAWIRDYIERWALTRRRAVCTTVVFLVAVFLVGVLQDYPTSWHLITHGHDVPPVTHTIWAASGAAVLVGAFAYAVVVGLFRRKYHRADAPDLGGPMFKEFFSDFKRGVRRLLLFLLTVSFLPVCRVNLENFAPEYNTTTLQYYGCHFVDSEGRSCCLKGIPNLPCFSSPDFKPLYALQIASVFMFVYIVGLPIFFLLLIREGIRRVNTHYAPIHKESKADEARLRSALSSLRAQHGGNAWERAQEMDKLRLLIREEERYRRNTYALFCENEKCPQSYLYQSYKRPWWWYKVWQLIEKLALLLISLYTLADSERTDRDRLIASTSVALLSFLIVVVFRPLTEPLEAGLDVTSRLANLSNSGVALLKTLVSPALFPSYAVDVWLVGTNGMNAVMFLVALSLGPFRYYLEQKKLRRGRPFAPSTSSRASIRLAGWAMESPPREVQEVVDDTEPETGGLERPASGQLPAGIPGSAIPLHGMTPVPASQEAGEAPDRGSVGSPAVLARNPLAQSQPVVSVEMALHTTPVAEHGSSSLFSPSSDGEPGHEEHLLMSDRHEPLP